MLAKLVPAFPINKKFSTRIARIQSQRDGNSLQTAAASSRGDTFVETVAQNRGRERECRSFNILLRITSNGLSLPARSQRKPNVKKLFPRRVVALVTVAAFGASIVEGADPLRIPPLAEPLPEPPRQRDAWTPPANGLPAVVNSAIEALFKQGLADPRGCEYREIQIGVGSPWIGGGFAKTVHGWVLPGEGGGRYAVAWNGLVYPTAEIGPLADLRKDVEAMLDAPAPGPYLRTIVAEGRAVETTELMPGHVFLLARLGEDELASRGWDRLSQADSNRFRYYQQSPLLKKRPHVGIDPYLDAAVDLAWFHFERAATAHMRDDTRLALDAARFLYLFQTQAAREAKQRGFHYDPPLFNGREEERRSYFPFLKQLPELQEDLLRRVRQAPRRPITTAELKQLPDASSRIQRLIQDLEFVRVRQRSQPGGIVLAESPIVAALVNEGESAVEPLLDCLERDSRLTQSVGFGRSFHRDRRFLSARSAALSALQSILSASFHGGSEEIREYWRKFKGVALEERWALTLEDDEAGLDRWLEAAGNIVRPTDIMVIHGSGVTISPQNRRTPRVMRGEPLRARSAPAISELMARRAETAFVKTKFDFHKTCRLALALAQWDIAAAVPTLKKLSARCRERYTNTNPIRQADTMLGMFHAEMTCERVRAGDGDALKEHADWLAAKTPAELSSNAMASLRPLWENPESPSIEGLATKLFLTPDSPWSDLPWRKVSFADPVKSALMGLPPFRAMLLAKLADDSTAGKWSYDPATDRLDTGGLSPGGWFYQPAEQKLTEPTTAAVRVCDVVAYQLSQLEGVPYFHPFTSESDRNEGIKRIQVFLRKYGEAFRYDSNLDGRRLGRGAPAARLSFSVLNRPALQTDVDAGRAIFALPPNGSVRPVPLVQYPLAARWTTLQDHVVKRQAFSREKGSHTLEHFASEGQVWQAEETVRDGKTNRFYGFVGPFTMARAPAEEIEFPAPHPWRSLTEGVDGAFRLPRVEMSAAMALSSRPLDKPLRVVLQLRNRSGLPQRLPVANGGEDSPASPRGWNIALEFLQPTSAGPEAEWAAIKDPNAWNPVRRKSRKATPLTMTSQTAAPTESVDAIAFVLQEWFEMDRPGVYRVRARFEIPRDGLANISGDLESHPIKFE